MQLTVIRQECLVPAYKSWVQPHGIEVQETLRLARVSTAEAAEVLGMAKGGRNVRKWVNDETLIPYAAWAVLCHLAGLGLIWRSNAQAPYADLDDNNSGTAID